MKIITVILSFIAIFCFPSCKKTNPYENKISQLREISLYYDCNDYAIFAYPEICEEPLKNDGIVSNLEKRISFKLQVKKQSKDFENCKIEFQIKDKIYKANFEYSPLASFLYCKIAVDTLPTSELYLKFNFSNQSTGINLQSQKNDNTLNYVKVLEHLKKTDDFTRNFLSSKNGELKVRFIDNDDYDYWYFGFVETAKITSYLIDGETGEVLAKKQEK